MKRKIRTKRASKKKSSPTIPKPIRQYNKSSKENFKGRIKRKLLLFRQSISNNSKLFGLLGIIILLIIVLVQVVNSLSFPIKRSSHKVENVYGLSYKIPTYPGSKFAFPNHKETAEVEKLISYDMSCYVLPSRENFTKVSKYYIEVMKELNWEFVGESSLADLEKEHGLYFYSDELKTGLRIYTLAQDIWYETISIDDAKSMLADRREKKKKLIHTIQSLHGEELPDSYRFSIRYSYEYRVQNINAPDFPVSGFSLEKSDNRISVIPYRWQASITIENALENYINDHISNISTPEIQSIRLLPTDVVKNNEITYYIKMLVLDENSYRIAAFADENDRIIYIIDGSKCDTILFDYLIENLKIR